MERFASIRRPVGAAALVFSVGYFVGDAIEAAQGGFSTGKLVVYPLIHDVPDFDTLSEIFGIWMFLGGAVMVFAGLALGWATIRAEVLPRWSAVALMAGVVLVAATQGAPEGIQLVAAGIRDLGFAGMGAALLARPAVSRPAPALPHVG